MINDSVKHWFMYLKRNSICECQNFAKFAFLYSIFEKERAKSNYDK